MVVAHFLFKEIIKNVLQRNVQICVAGASFVVIAENFSSRKGTLEFRKNVKIEKHISL